MVAALRMLSLKEIYIEDNDKVCIDVEKEVTIVKTKK
jgi:hypothetical protein